MEHGPEEETQTGVLLAEKKKKRQRNVASEE
jgi:hypothetical protein